MSNQKIILSKTAGNYDEWSDQTLQANVKTEGFVEMVTTSIFPEQPDEDDLDPNRKPDEIVWIFDTCFSLATAPLFPGASSPKYLQYLSILN